MPLSKDIDSMFNNALFGATLHTWGTKSRSSNGMINFLDYQFFGGDVGHASISMKLPINDTSRQWIETYCCRQTYQEFVSGAKKTTTYEEFLDKVEKRIPFAQKKMSVRKAVYNHEAKLVASAENVSEQAYFEIYFSWWPSRLHNLEQDMVAERHGKSFNYSDEWKEYLNPESRLHKGMLGQRFMDYVPSTIVHQRDLSDSMVQRITKKNRLLRIEDQLSLIELLSRKIYLLDDFKIDASTKLMFKNINLNVNFLRTGQKIKTGLEVAH